MLGPIVRLQSSKYWKRSTPTSARLPITQPPCPPPTSPVQGKSPERLGPAVDGGPTPRKYAALLTTEQCRKVHGAEGARHHAVEAKRREQVTLTPEEIMKGLQQVGTELVGPGQRIVGVAVARAEAAGLRSSRDAAGVGVCMPVAMGQ